jgi:hypothetical protein
VHEQRGGGETVIVVGEGILPFVLAGQIGKKILQGFKHVSRAPRRPLGMSGRSSKAFAEHITAREVDTARPDAACNGTPLPVTC